LKAHKYFHVLSVSVSVSVGVGVSVSAAVSVLSGVSLWLLFLWMLSYLWKV